MKELSIEEKAKAYDRVREKIAVRFGTNVAEEIFSEFEESEDERIRKGLINYFNHHKNGINIFYGIKGDDILAWLEKQGEQKQEINNFDVLPGLYKCVHRMFDGTPDGRLLFEVGNVYRCLSKHDRAEFEVSYGHSVYLEDPVVCKHFIPFEKQDEVESDNDDIEVEEKGIRKAFNKIWDEKQSESSDQIHYWTEEEIEPIISDYLRGTEHYGGMIARLRCLKPKSLEKQCKQKPQRMISAEAKEAMYDKPANTVEQKCEESKTKVFDAPTPFEDKLYAFVAACEFLTLPSKIEFIKEHSQEILDAAREQIGKEQSSTWSKEDEKEYKYVLKFVDNILNNCGNKKDYEHCKRCYDWLKSLRPQNNITDEELAQAKKDAYNDALDKIEYHSGEPTFDDGWSAAIWYLKKKNAMPQTQWKPSDEQLEALKNAIHIKPFKNPSDSILWGLYEQLNKLKS